MRKPKKAPKPITAVMDPLAVLRQLEESIITLRSEEKSVASTIDDEDFDEEEEEDYEEEEWEENGIDFRKREHGIIYISINFVWADLSLTRINNLPLDIFVSIFLRNWFRATAWRGGQVHPNQGISVCLLQVTNKVTSIILFRPRRDNNRINNCKLFEVIRKERIDRNDWLTL